MLRWNNVRDAPVFLWKTLWHEMVADCALPKNKWNLYHHPILHLIAFSLWFNFLFLLEICTILMLIDVCCLTIDCGFLIKRFLCGIIAVLYYFIVEWYSHINICCINWVHFSFNEIIREMLPERCICNSGLLSRWKHFKMILRCISKA